MHTQELRPQSPMRPEIVIGLVVLSITAFTAGVGYAVRFSQATHPQPARAEVVDRIVETPREVQVFVEHSCHLEPIVDAPSALAGWLTYQDATRCFTLEYPRSWRVLGTDDLLQFAAQEGEPYAVLNISRVDARDGRAELTREEFAALSGDGYAPTQRAWMMASGWAQFESGDGSLAAVARHYVAATPRGEFHLRAERAAGDETFTSTLDRMVRSFQTQ